MSLLKDIEHKLANGEPLSLEEGVRLFNHKNLLEVGQLANQMRENLHGDVTYYNWNLHLNTTNICEASCMFCSFARLQAGMPMAYSMSLEESLDWIKKRYRTGMTEIHIVNGLNPDLPFSYYEELLKLIKSEYPALHIKAFTAVEIYYFSQKFNMSYQEVLERLTSAGLDSLPGGGAEIFSARARKKICRDKVDAENWLAIHKTAHEMGLKTNCTMLYGTIETIEERIEHLIQLRQLQEETGGFQAFIGLAFHNDGNRLKNIPSPTGAEDLRMIALARLMLSNIPNIKAYWIMLELKTAQMALYFGANDLDGTVTEEKIYHMSGSHSPNSLTLEEIRRQIKAAGRVPIERTSVYTPVVRSKDAGKDVKHNCSSQSNQMGFGI